MEFIYKENLLELIIDKQVKGNIVLGRQSQSVFRILRVFVDESLRGRGLAGMLMENLVKIARDKNLKLVPVCSYAVLHFQKNKQNNDVLFVPNAL